MLSPEQLNQIRIERCLHLGQYTAAFNIGERTEAFRNFASLENLGKLEDALVDYWAVVGAFGATKASYEEILKIYGAMLQAETPFDRAQIFCDFINVAYPDAHFCEIAIASMRQFI